MAEPGPKRMSVDEFLAWEAEQEPRYELIDGIARMMTGGTRAHDTVRLAVGSEFRRLLRQRRCQAQLDMRVVCATGNVRYPDAQIDCGPRDQGDLTAREPTVVVEVLSPSSATTDFIVKLRDYGSVESITTYLIFRQERPHVSVFRRQGAGLVLAEEHEGFGAIVDLADVGIALRLADVYDETDLAWMSGAVSPQG